MRTITAVSASVLLAVFATSAFAQSSYSTTLTPRTVDSWSSLLEPVANGPRNIMLIGYWPPSNNMLRPWSPNPSQNPGGWVGENWNNSGYNVISYFPEYPGRTGSPWGKGEGDFEVDYQDTSADFWRITDQIKPVAIISFSRENSNVGWQLEGGNRNYALNSWTSDYEAPFRPTADLPIANEPVGQEYFSTLPMSDIVTNIEAEFLPSEVDPNIAPIDNGRFLSNFLGYHSNWYHELNNDPTSPFVNLAAGHVHVGTNLDLADATRAVEITLQTTIDHINATPIPEPATAALLIAGGALAVRRRR